MRGLRRRVNEGKDEGTEWDTHRELCRSGRAELASTDEGDNLKRTNAPRTDMSFEGELQKNQEVSQYAINKIVRRLTVSLESLVT